MKLHFKIAAAALAVGLTFAFTPHAAFALLAGGGAGGNDEVKKWTCSCKCRMKVDYMDCKPYLTYTCDAGSVGVSGGGTKRKEVTYAKYRRTGGTAQTVQGEEVTQ